MFHVLIGLPLCHLDKMYRQLRTLTTFKTLSWQSDSHDQQLPAVGLDQHVL